MNKFGTFFKTGKHPRWLKKLVPKHVQSKHKCNLTSLKCENEDKIDKFIYFRILLPMLLKIELVSCKPLCCMLYCYPLTIMLLNLKVSNNSQGFSYSPDCV